MFWAYNTNISSEIEKLLNKKDVTLQEIMDAEDVINECKTQGKAFIDFLLKPETMEELVNLTISEPSMDLDERIRFKYPNIACEILTSDVPAINERLASDEVLLDRFYSFLENEPPLNPLLASYFSKIMGALIAKKTEQVLDFLKDKNTFISLLLKHIGTSAIMDLMLKLMTQIEGNDIRETVLNWLDSQHVIDSLVGLMNPKIDKDKHFNVAQLLCDFVRTTRDNQRNTTEKALPDLLLNALESPKIITLLLDNMLEKEYCESAIVGGVQILLALLDIFQFSIPKLINSTTDLESVDIEHKEQIEKNVATSVQKRIKDFHEILSDPPKKAPINSTIGLLNPPLGNTRLHVMKLISALISTNNSDLINNLIELGTFKLILDLFFKYQWNNFLHTQVVNCLSAAFNNQIIEGCEGELNVLSKHLLFECNIIERVLDAWKDNDEKQQQSKGLRQGYMGHLIDIINKIVEFIANPSIGQCVEKELPEIYKRLEEFSELSLKETNNLRNTLLGGVYPKASNDNGGNYDNMAYPQEQNYTYYQVQGIEGCGGIPDSTFTDRDGIDDIGNQVDISYAIDDLSERHELFKQVCARNINALDDNEDTIFDDEEEKLEKNEKNTYSSDSDEDASPNVPMDVDPWATQFKSAPLEMADPWSANIEKSGSDANLGGWADFSLASFDANFNEAFDDKKTTKVSENEEETSNNVAQNKDKAAGDQVVTLTKNDNEPSALESNEISENKTIEISEPSSSQNNGENSNESV